MTKKYINAIIVVGNNASFLLHMVLSFFIILLASYFFGYELLLDPLSGNDSLNNLTYIVHFDKYFPEIPLWFPYQGGGVSALLGYPQLYTYSVIVLKRLSGLTFVSSMGILNFASLVVPAWGIYLFVATRLKNKTGGLIAGLLYLLSPMVYVWIWGAGFLAQVFSVIFVPYYLILYDHFLESVLNKKSSILSLLGIAILGTAAFLAHPATSLGLFAFSFFYSFIRALFDKRENIWIRIQKNVVVLIATTLAVLGLSAFWYLPLRSYLGFAGRGLKTTLDTSIFAPIQTKGVMGLYGVGDGYPFGDFSIYTPVWVMAILAIIVGIFKNRKVFALGILAILSIFFTGSLKDFLIIGRFSFFLAQFFDLRSWYPITIIVNPIAGAMGMVVLSEVVLKPLFWLETRKKIKGLKYLIKTIRIPLHSLISLVFTGFALYLLNPLSGMYSKERPYVIPIGSTIEGINTKGIWSRTFDERCLLSKDHAKYSPLCDMPFIGEYFNISSFVEKCDGYNVDNIKPIVCTGKKAGIKRNQWTEWNEELKTSYQVVQEDNILVDIEKRDVEEFVKKCYEDKNGFIYLHSPNSPCLSLGHGLLQQLLHWPRITLYHGNDNFSAFGDNVELPEDKKDILIGENHRVDVTPHFGSSVKSWKIRYNSSMLNAYTGQISLIKTFYSIFNDNFYDNSKTPPEVLNNLAGYFGTEAVVVNASKSPMQSFEDGEWTRMGSEFAIMFPPFDTGLVSVGSFSKVLVVGDTNKGAYKQVFRNVIGNSIPFEKGILIDGGSALDQYSQNELNKYSLVILQGYKYKNRSTELSKLNNYVKKGGSLFIDTGWQYVSDDWGRDEQNNIFTTVLPEPFPVTKTQWGGVGKDWYETNINSQYSDGVNISGFGSLSWGDSEWSVASANETRGWAKPILSKGKSILIAGGNLGNGKVVWSGMNMFAHAEDKKSKDENRLLQNIFDYLLAEKTGNITSSNLKITRPWPDRLIIDTPQFTSGEGSLYFREAYHPSWIAFIESAGKKKKLSIQMAGPTFMLVDLPKLNTGDRIVFEFRFPFTLKIGIGITIFTLIIIGFLIVNRYLLRGKFSIKISAHYANHISKFTKKVSSRWSNIKGSVSQNEDETY